MERHFPSPQACRERSGGVDLRDHQAPSPEAAWEARDRQQLLYRHALELMQTDFPGKTWKACWEVVVAGKTAAVVAGEQGMTVGAVHADRFRVPARLRQELAGILE